MVSVHNARDTSDALQCYMAQVQEQASTGPSQTPAGSAYTQWQLAGVFNHFRHSGYYPIMFTCYHYHSGSVTKSLQHLNIFECPPQVSCEITGYFQGTNSIEQYRSTSKKYFVGLKAGSSRLLPWTLSWIVLKEQVPHWFTHVPSFSGNA